MNPGEARHYQLPRRVETLGPLRAEARELALAHGFGPQAAEDFELCVHEAASNAMVHGSDDGDCVGVEVVIAPWGRGLRATVRNGGPGFDVETMLAGLHAAGEEPRGRGMRIISSLSDSFEWSERGRELTFVKLP